MAEESSLKIVVEAVNRAKAELDKVQEQLKGVAQSSNDASTGISGMNSMMEGALSLLATYAGTKGIMGMVNAYEDANRTMIQSKFFIRGMTGDEDTNLKTLQAWGSEMQRTLGVQEDYATLIAARLGPKFQDMNKIQEWGNILLQGQRIGLLDAESASIMLMRAADGNTRAMTWLAYSLGIIIPEFASMDTIMATLKKRMEGLTGELTSFDQNWNILKTTFRKLMEEAGGPIVELFGSILGGILKLMTAVPVFGDVIKAVSIVVSTSLAGLGIGLAINSIAKLLGYSVQFGPWGIAIGAAIAGVAISISAVKESMKLEGYEMSWDGFARYVKDTVAGIWIYVKDTWDKLRNYINQPMEIADPNRKKGTYETVTDWLHDFFSGKKFQFGGYIPETGPYILHRGEQVIPSGSTKNGSGVGTVSITITGNTFLDEGSAVRMGDMIVKALQRNIRI